MTVPQGSSEYCSIAWLPKLVSHNCAALELDSGARHGAYRSYLRKGMDIESHHFRLRLSGKLIQS